MSDAATTADTQKTPPADAAHPGADDHKTTDNTNNQTDNGKGPTTTNWLMAEVHSEWDSLKKTLGISGETPKAKEAGSVEVTDIYKSGDTKAAPSDHPAATGDAKPAAAGASDNKTTVAGSGETKPPAAEGDKPKDQAAAPAPEHHWWDGIASMGSKVAGYVEQGWDSLSDKVGDTYKSIMTDSDNKTTHVDAHVGADGKPDYFQQSNDNGTRTLTDGEQRFTDAKGGTIVKNTKTGEITSQSADGDDVYTKKADGTEVYRSKNIEYTKNKDGTFEARDDKGNVTEVGDKGAITQIDGIFKVAQRITSIDATTMKPEKGQLETMTDGQRYMDRHGDIIVARNDGTREITTPEGQHFRVGKDRSQAEIEENGQWRQLTKDEFEKFHACRMHGDGHGHNRFEVGGVTIGPDGKVATADKVTVGEVKPDGKMVSTIPTVEGKPAVVTTNPDHTSTLELNNHVTKVNPDDKTHLVERFAENADGSLGAPEFNYNSLDQCFWTPDLTWTPDGTYLGWNDTFIDPFDSVTSGGSTIFDGSPDAEKSAEIKSDTSCQNADTAVASVTAKIGSQSLDASDLSALNGSLGELDGALNVALSAGNFAAACEIIKTKGEVATAIGEASQQVALSEHMRSQNMTEGDIVSASDEVNSRGVHGAAISQEVLVLGPNAQTFEGKLAYMSEFGIAGLTDEQKQRLTA